MSIVKVIWKSKTKDDKLGYIRLSSRSGNKTTVKSLALDPVEKKHFNANTQRMRASFSQSEYYNNFIQSKLDEVNKKGNTIKYLNDDKKSLIVFMNKIIDKCENEGTKMKYENIRNLIILFNEFKYGASDVKFSELTVDFLEEFKKYLKIERRNKNNSIVYKMKSFKSFISKAHREKVYNFDVNPFDLIKSELIETNVDVLNKEDLKKLMHTPLVEVYRSGKKFGQPLPNLDVLNGIKYANYNKIDDIRNFFLFQLFCQGIRVSDLLTLRWNDFYIHQDQIRIKKRMVKVKSYIDVLMNFNTMEYLKNYIPVKQLPEHLLKSYSEMWYKTIGHARLSVNGQKYEDINTAKVLVEIDDIVIQNFNLSFKPFNGEYFTSVNELNKIIDARKKELIKKIKKTDAVIYEQKITEIYTSDEKINYLEKLSLIVKSKAILNNSIMDEASDDVKLVNYKLFKGIVEFLSSSKETKNSFVFPLLKDGDFADIIDDDFSSMNKYQYNSFTGTRAYYNRLLKVVALQCKISKPLTSHVSRHSFTSLMIEIGVNLNLFDLMTSLGHKHLNTTQVYINKFSSKRVDSLNKDLVDFMNKD